jgi:hypothetical protein
LKDCEEKYEKEIKKADMLYENINVCNAPNEKQRYFQSLPTYQVDDVDTTLPLVNVICEKKRKGKNARRDLFQ